MDHTERGTAVFQCSTCGNVGIGQGEIRCCEDVMAPADDVAGGASDGTSGEEDSDDLPVVAPTLDELLQTVFDMSDTELDVCLCVMEAGELTVTDLAEQIAYDRSVVARHLNHLADLGVVEKRRRLLEQGGHVYVYTPKDPETVRRNLQRLFLAWTRKATVQLDALRREKVETLVENEAPETEWRIFQQE